VSMSLRMVALLGPLLSCSRCMTGATGMYNRTLAGNCAPVRIVHQLEGEAVTCLNAGVAATAKCHHCCF
jgi:hypothetical protein